MRRMLLESVEQWASSLMNSLVADNGNLQIGTNLEVDGDLRVDGNIVNELLKHTIAFNTQEHVVMNMDDYEDGIYSLTTISDQGTIKITSSSGLKVVPIVLPFQDLNSVFDGYSIGFTTQSDSVSFNKSAISSATSDVCITVVKNRGLIICWAAREL